MRNHATCRSACAPHPDEPILRSLWLLILLAADRLCVACHLQHATPPRGGLDGDDLYCTWCRTNLTCRPRLAEATSGAR